MPTWSVNVPVADLISGGFAHIGDLHFEMERNTCERVVPIEKRMPIGYFLHGEHTMFARLELHAFFNIAVAETIQWHPLKKILVHFAIAQFGGDHGNELVAGLFTFHL